MEDDQALTHRAQGSRQLCGGGIDGHHGTDAGAADLRCPRAAGLGQEQHERRCQRKITKGLEGARHPRQRLGEHDDVGLVLFDERRQLRCDAHGNPPLAMAAQSRLDACRERFLRRDDQDRGGARRHTGIPIPRTDRCTSAIGTASASVLITIVLTPTTRPAPSAIGPPELPGPSRRSA